MGRVANTYSHTYGSVNTGAKTQSMTVRRYASSDQGDISVLHRILINTFSPPTTKYDEVSHLFGANTDWENHILSLPCDTTHYYRCTADFYTMGSGIDYKFGQTKNFKTYAIDPTLDEAPDLSEGVDGADAIAFGGEDWTPGTLNSTATLYIDYKKTSDGTWTEGASQDSGTGYTARTLSANEVTGLDPDTSYDFRFRCERPSATNSGTHYSSTSSRSTLPDVPEVTTDAATNVSAGVAGTPNDGAATLNATIDRNLKTDLEWRFAYDTTPTGGTYGNTTSWTASTTEPESVESAIGSLSESTEYGYRVEVRWNSGADTDEGSEVTFTVPADPAAEAKDEAHMFVYEFDAIQGEDKKVYFSFRARANVSSDTYINAAATDIIDGADGNGDILVYIDGVLKASNSGKPDNNVTRVGTSGLFYLNLDGTNDLAGEDIMIQFVDADTGDTTYPFRDFSVHVRTIMKTSQLDVDASGLSNQSAIVATGVGTGNGILAVAGATGDDIKGILGDHVLISGTNNATGTDGTHFDMQDFTNINGTDDYYNSAIAMIVAGTGIGQSRVIIGYVGSTNVAEVDEAWVVNPNGGSTIVVAPGARALNAAGAEVTSVPSATASTGTKIDFLYQRFAFRITQTATLQTWYQSDALSTVGTRAVSDNGTTQDVGALS